MNLSLLLDLPISGVFAICNDIDKLVYVLYTSNIHSALAKLNSSIVDGSQAKLARDRNKLRLVVLETLPGDLRILRSRYDYWLSHYKALGYSNYRNYEGVSKYKLSIRLDRLPSGDIIHCVYLVSRNSRKILLAAFPTAAEADSWVSSTYGSSTSYTPVFYNSDLTNRLRRMG